MFNFSKVYLPMLAVSVLAATATATASAGIPNGATDPQPSITVRYDDLNLTTEDGRSSLYRRLNRAASHVCPTPMEFGRITQAEVCQASAVQRALHEIGGPVEAQMASEHRALTARNVTRG
jgi:UrcA family protein